MTPRAVRLGRLVLLAVAVAGVVSCTGGRRRRPISTDPLEPSAELVVPTSFQRFREIEWLTPVSRVLSSHPVGTYNATTLVDEKAAAYGKRGRAPMPTGALVVQALSRDIQGPPELYYVMERREAGYFPEGGDWAYSVVSPQGTVKAGGKLPLCARCHAEAVREHLFERVADP